MIGYIIFAVLGIIGITIITVAVASLRKKKRKRKRKKIPSASTSRGLDNYKLHKKQRVTVESLCVEEKNIYNTKISTAIENFFLLPHRVREKNYFVLDTAVAKLPLTELKKLNELKQSCNISYRIMKNTYYELMLLSQSSQFYKDSASYILNTLCEGEIIIPYDTEELYTFSDQKGIMSETHNKNLTDDESNYIFVFNDNVSAYDEFVKFVKNENFYYLLLSNKVKGNSPQISKLSDARGFNREYSRFDSWVKGSCVEAMPIEYKTSEPTVSEKHDMNQIVYVGEKSYRLSELNQLARGGEAVIFALPDDSSTVLKIFKRVVTADNKLKKIAFLIQNADRLPAENLSLPIEFVYNENNDVIGYSMRRVNGKTLASLYKIWYRSADSESVESQKTEIAKQLVRIVIELRMLGIYVADPTCLNIMIENGKPVIIDTDSFQIGRITSPSITPGYDYPLLVSDSYSLKDHLREPRHFTFGFVSLLFSLFLLTTSHPWAVDDADMYRPDEVYWYDSYKGHIKRFPFSLRKPDDNADSMAFRNWEDLSLGKRALFMKAFNFDRQPISYGEIIKAFGLLK